MEQGRALESREASTASGPQVGDLIPPFTLRTVTGETIRRHDYRGRRHLVLAFVHAPGCAACAALLAGLAARYHEYRAEGAEVLAFLPGHGAAAAAAATAGDREHVRQLPFPVLCDDTGAVRERYGARTATGEPLAALFVTDRYGEVTLRAVAPESPTASDPAGAAHGLPLDELLSLVGLLQVRCAI